MDANPIPAAADAEDVELDAEEAELFAGLDPELAAELATEAWSIVKSCARLRALLRNPETFARSGRYTPEVLLELIEFSARSDIPPPEAVQKSAAELFTLHLPAESRPSPAASNQIIKRALSAVADAYGPEEGTTDALWFEMHHRMAHVLMESN
jgi:hypothetical protein